MCRTTGGLSKESAEKFAELNDERFSDVSVIKQLIRLWMDNALGNVSPGVVIGQLLEILIEEEKRRACEHLPDPKLPSLKSGSCGPEADGGESPCP
jgi:hypothetical protein